jgi:predicted enzyme related to lactoylglutathione lyase
MSDHGRFIWYELITPDVDGAKRFYGQLLGWTSQEMAGPPGAEPYTVENFDGMGVAGIMHRGAAMKNMPPNWTGYVCVDDCDAAADKAKALGGSVQSPPMDIPGIGRFAIISDPGGAVIAIMKPAPQPGEAPHRPARGAPGHASWRELAAGDIDKDIAFYQQLFGWTETARHDMGAMGAYHLFGNQDGEIGGMMQKPPTVSTPHWLYYFAVDDINAGAERLKAGGGKVLNGPMQVPDGAWVVQASDAAGAQFAIVQPPEEYLQRRTG